MRLHSGPPATAPAAQLSGGAWRKCGWESEHGMFGMVTALVVK
jgi:hypothetical protein